MDQLPRLGKRELICLLKFTCNYVVFVRRGFLFLWVLGMGYVILLWHSLSLPYNYFIRLSGKSQIIKCNGQNTQLQMMFVRSILHSTYNICSSKKMAKFTKSNSSDNINVKIFMAREKIKINTVYITIKCSCGIHYS